MLYYEKTVKEGSLMANYGKYYIAVRLRLLKQHLEANAGRTRIVKRRELEDLLKEHDMPVEKKTLYQDFAALGDVCGLQLEYDVHKKGYRLLNPPFEPMPTMARSSATTEWIEWNASASLWQ